MTTADKVTATPGAISRDREAAKAWIDQARVDWDKGDVEGAASCCRRALALDSSNVDALANLGTLLWLEGRVEEGEARNFEAHAIDPGHLGAVLNLALLSHDAGDVETSLAWLRK